MAVHPGEGEENNDKVTLVNVLLHRYGKSGLSDGENSGERPGIVHRLDKDTSGLMIVCKTNETHEKLKDLFQNRHESLTKSYQALVLGNIPQNSGTLDAPLKRHPGAKMGHKMVTTTPNDPKAKPAVTHYQVVKHWALPRNVSYTLIQLQIETGRTHQIRVHMSSSSHPIVGDALYATKNSAHKVPFLLLTSKELRFEHPITKEKLHFTIDLPPHFSSFIEKLDSQQESLGRSQLATPKGKKKLHNPYEEDLLM